MTEDGFLKRWSERKRAGAALPEPGSDRDSAAMPEAPPDEPETLPEAELAKLTPVEAITGDTPLGQYLRRGVPVALRRAALRRAWTANPKIRDYLDEARDYAWDWNTPGGVPGSGTLGAGRSLAAAVSRILDGPLSTAQGEQGEAAPPVVLAASSNKPEGLGGGADEPSSHPTPVVPAPVDLPSVPPVRRHGKAVPRPMNGNGENDPV